jgi:L-fuculose-phosphate aldolase
MYTLREGVGAVAHAHTPYLTAYAICNKEFTCDCYPEFIAHFKEIKVAPYGAPGTHDIYAGAKSIIQDHYVVLLANHGVLAIGSTALKACNRIDAAEAAAKIMAIAHSIGTPVPLPESEIKRIRAIIKPM